jgi:uncharacterized membrane protein
MRIFSIRPTLTLKGRTFKGLRGWSGKPTHPPLTDIPVAAYVLGAIFDVVSFVGRDHGWSRDFFRAATFLFIGGAVVSVFTALTGFWDWLRSTEKGTQARRTANTHAVAMIVVSMLAVLDIGVRLNGYGERGHTPAGLVALSVVLAALVALGATFGGSLVFEHGFNVETATDSAVWHVSEVDVMPGDADD